MQATFAFGKTGLVATLPDGPQYDVAEIRSAAPLENVTAALGKALDHPIGSRPLVELAAGKRTAAISVCDITRPAPNRVTLPPLLERLHAAGIPEDGITILIATGLHRAATDAEIEAILGPEIPARYRVVNHDARSIWRSSVAGIHAARYAGLYRQALYRSRSAHHARLHRAASDAWLFRRPQADRTRSRGAGDDQGDPLAALHARADGDRRIDRGEPAARGVA